MRIPYKYMMGFDKIHCMYILCRTPRFCFIIAVEFYISKWHSWDTYKKHLQFHNLRRSSFSKENKNKASTIKKDWIEFSQRSPTAQFVVFVCFLKVPVDIYLLKSVSTSSSGTGSLQQYLELLSTIDFSIIFCRYCTHSACKCNWHMLEIQW